MVELIAMASKCAFKLAPKPMIKKSFIPTPDLMTKPSISAFKLALYTIMKLMKTTFDSMTMSLRPYSYHHLNP